VGEKMIKSERIDIAGYIFSHVQDIHPARNSCGQVEEFMKYCYKE